MFTGAHFLFYSRSPDEDRRFLRETLGFLNVDVGDGWLIFRLPPAEIAVHPSDEGFTQAHGDHDMLGAVLYLMCNDVDAVHTMLTKKGVELAPVHKADWGRFTSMRLPSGGSIGLYQPAHQTALDL